VTRHLRSGRAPADRRLEPSGRMAIPTWRPIQPSPAWRAFHQYRSRACRPYFRRIRRSPTRRHLQSGRALDEVAPSFDRACRTGEQDASCWRSRLTLPDDARCRRGVRPPAVHPHRRSHGRAVRRNVVTRGPGPRPSLNIHGHSKLPGRACVEGGGSKAAEGRKKVLCHQWPMTLRTSDGEYFQMFSEGAGARLVE